MEIPFNLRK